MKHSNATDRIIYDMLEQGCDYFEIARRLISYWTIKGEPQFVSKNAVKMRCRQRGWLDRKDGALPPFELAIKPSSKIKPERRVPVAKKKTVEVPAEDETIMPAVQGTGSMHFNRSPAPETYSAAAKAVYESDDGCRWPYGEVDSENFAFCGRRRGTHQSYCERHANNARARLQPSRP